MANQAMVPGGGHDVLSKCRNALGVLVLTPRIRTWLLANDPKALSQAEEALVMADETILGDDVRIREMLAEAAR